MSDDKTTSKPRLTRRAFIKGAGLAAAVSAIPVHLAKADQPAPAAEGVLESLGPEAVPLELKINGTLRNTMIEPRATLLAVLRDHLQLTGTKLVCDRGACGACTVHLDGRPVTSCMMLAVDARGKTITTIEGLGNPDKPHPVQSAFVQHDAMQCGFCTPGMVMSVAALLRRNPGATLEQIKHAVAGNTCRCGTYPHVFAAAVEAARALKS